MINIRHQVITPKSKFSILLVDDEERILNFLKTKLKLLGYGVILAGNGIEAIKQVQGQDAYSAENGRLSATKRAACPEQTGHLKPWELGGWGGVGLDLV